jgi:ribonuclease HI
MPWIEATMRGQRVLARVNAEGSLAVEGGRVEIRYKPNDGRAYRAAQRNLEIAPGARTLPDDACAPADPVAAGSRSKSAGSAGAGPARAGSAGDAPEPGGWVAFTDGACSGNPGPAGSGVVLVAPDGKTYERSDYLGEATNNVAELTGILRALEWAPAEARSIVVRTDSQYAIGVLQKGWKAKANQELVGRTKEAVVSRRARLVYVPGHQGVPLNERADELAREAVLTHRSRADQITWLPG